MTRQSRNRKLRKKRNHAQSEAASTQARLDTGNPTGTGESASIKKATRAPGTPDGKAVPGTSGTAELEGGHV